MRGTVWALCLEPPPLCLLPPLVPPPPFGGLRPARGGGPFMWLAWGAPLAWGAGVGWQVCWGNAPDTRGGVTGSSLGSREKGARARVSEWTAHTARRQQGPPWGDHRLRGRWRDLRVRLWEPPRGSVVGLAEGVRHRAAPGAPVGSGLPEGAPQDPRPRVGTAGVARGPVHLDWAPRGTVGSARPAASRAARLPAQGRGPQLLPRGPRQDCCVPRGGGTPGPWS